MTGMAKKPELFVCEFITGGGLYNAPLPSALAREGGLMLEALLADLLATDQVSVVTSRDVRLPPLKLPVSMVQVDTVQINAEPWPLWQQCIEHADLVWLIAPESGGMLEKMSRLVPAGKLLGCPPQAITIAASKYATAQWLMQHDIAVVPTWKSQQAPAGLPRYVAKPDDGVSCEDTRCIDDFARMQAWLQDGRSASHVIQPWLPGEAGSISMLCSDGKAWLLSCNRQLVELQNDGFAYRGSIVNGMAQYWDDFAALAQHIAAAMPALSGYVGVDVMVDGDNITVLEINPRLTTSYAGVSQATGLNVAGLALDLFYNRPMQALAHCQRHVVTIQF
jgi:predicted ATP-grasp superfamily ATP-dependent carboligase